MGSDKFDSPRSRCSLCDRPLSDDAAARRFRPFCSSRCQMVDLGRWLDEEIAIPHEGGPEDDGPGESVREIRFD